MSMLISERSVLPPSGQHNFPIYLCFDLKDIVPNFSPVFSITQSNEYSPLFTACFKGGFEDL